MTSMPAAVSARTVAGSARTSSTDGLQQTTPSVAGERHGVRRRSRCRSRPRRTSGAASRTRRDHVGVEALHDRAGQQAALGDLLDDGLDLVEGGRRLDLQEQLGRRPRRAGRASRPAVGTRSARVGRREPGAGVERRDLVEADSSQTVAGAGRWCGRACGRGSPRARRRRSSARRTRRASPRRAPPRRTRAACSPAPRPSSRGAPPGAASVEQRRVDLARGDQDRPGRPATSGPASSWVTVRRPPGTSTATTPVVRPASRRADRADRERAGAAGQRLARAALVDPHRDVQVGALDRRRRRDHELDVHPGR